MGPIKTYLALCPPDNFREKLPVNLIFGRRAVIVAHGFVWVSWGKGWKMLARNYNDKGRDTKTWWIHGMRSVADSGKRPLGITP